MNWLQSFHKYVWSKIKLLIHFKIGHSCHRKINTRVFPPLIVEKEKMYDFWCKRNRKKKKYYAIILEHFVVRKAWQNHFKSTTTRDECSVGIVSHFLLRLKEGKSHPSSTDEIIHSNIFKSKEHATNNILENENI